MGHTVTRPMCHEFYQWEYVRSRLGRPGLCPMLGGPQRTPFFHMKKGHPTSAARRSDAPRTGSLSGALPQQRPPLCRRSGSLPHRECFSRPFRRSPVSCPVCHLCPGYRQHRSINALQSRGTFPQVERPGFSFRLSNRIQSTHSGSRELSPLLLSIHGPDPRQPGY